MSDQVAIKTWGNSQGIRIPKNILETFEERVAEYNGEISICDYDWGEPVGKEIL